MYATFAWRGRTTPPLQRWRTISTTVSRQRRQSHVKRSLGGFTVPNDLAQNVTFMHTNLNQTTAPIRHSIRHEQAATVGEQTTGNTKVGPCSDTFCSALSKGNTRLRHLHLQWQQICARFHGSQVLRTAFFRGRWVTQTTHTVSEQRYIKDNTYIHTITHPQMHFTIQAHQKTINSEHGDIYQQPGLKWTSLPSWANQEIFVGESSYLSHSLTLFAFVVACKSSRWWATWKNREWKTENVYEAFVFDTRKIPEQICGMLKRAPRSTPGPKLNKQVVQPIESGCS